MPDIRVKGLRAQDARPRSDFEKLMAMSQEEILEKYAGEIAQGMFFHRRRAGTRMKEGCIYAGCDKDL